MQIPFLDLKWQHLKIKDNLKIRWDRILDNTAFVMGEETRLFEENYAKYCNTKYCIGVSNGTDALILAIKSLNLPSGSEIITLPTSFIASASSVVNAGLIPRFAEVDIVTGNYDYNMLSSAVNEKTKAIIAVHLYGRMCDMDQIMDFSKKHNLKVIEDAAQAQGAIFIGKAGQQKAGSIGDIGCFSFYPGKNLGAYGHAGAVVTNNEELEKRIRRSRDHGSLGKYDHEILGSNNKIDNLQASVIDEKLKYLDNWNSLRREVAEKYYKGLQDIPNLYFVSPNNKLTISAHHIFPLRTIKRDEVILKLNNAGISTNIHYPCALHTFPFLQLSGCKTGDFPVAERLQHEIFSIPIYPGITDEQVDYVIKIIRNIFCVI